MAVFSCTAKLSLLSVYLFLLIIHCAAPLRRSLQPHPFRDLWQKLMHTRSLTAKELHGHAADRLFQSKSVSIRGLSNSITADGLPLLPNLPPLSKKESIWQGGGYFYFDSRGDERFVMQNSLAEKRSDKLWTLSSSQRQRRQTFDFSMNTPAPPATTNSFLDNNESGSDSEDFGGGGDVGSFLNGLFGSPDTENTSSQTQASSGNVTDQPADSAPQEVSRCQGMNICILGNPCQNGGTCFYNVSTCTVHCYCPPTTDGHPVFYDYECRYLDSSAVPSSTPSVHSSSPSPSSSSGPTTSPLRPIHERMCSDMFVCHRGYCDLNKTSGSKCICDQGWYGMFCENACTRHCSNGGVCRNTATKMAEICVCPHPWIGNNCTELPPDPENNETLVYWLSGSFAVGVVVLAAIGVLFMFYLWHRRLVFALKIVYYFMPYEDNDGRQYDAFVSYVLHEEDVSFVYNDLQPFLEQDMGFNLCLHQRDFVVGGAISDNIVEALEASRRFILVLSPRYLLSEWAEFEFQRAFHEMLKRKIRIIPVILEDISQHDSINPTLKTILQSVVPITFPGHAADERHLLKFWKKLKLTMPKIKKTDNSEECKTELSSANSTNEVVSDVVEMENINNNKHKDPPVISNGMPVVTDSKECDEVQDLGICTASISVGL